MTKMKNPECFDNEKILNRLMMEDEKFNILITQGNASNNLMVGLLDGLAAQLNHYNKTSSKFYSIDMSYIGNTLTIKVDQEEK